MEVTSTGLIPPQGFLMLNDWIKNYLFNSCIVSAISSGYSNVLELGTGTGLLSLLAAKCTLITPIYSYQTLHFARVFLQLLTSKNKLEHLVHIIDRLGAGCSVPARVNLLITDAFDNTLFGFGILHILSYAHKNLLEKNGRVIPARAEFYCCVIECEEIRKQHRFLHSELNGISLGGFKFHSRKSMPYIDVQSSAQFQPRLSYNLKKIYGGFRRITDPVKVLDVNFEDAKCIDNLIRGWYELFRLKIIEPGYADAVALWFDLHLNSETRISSQPFHEVIGPSNVRSYYASSWDTPVYPLKLNYMMPEDNLAINISFSNNVINIHPVSVDTLGLCGWIKNGQVHPLDTYYLEIEELYHLNDTSYNLSLCTAISNLIKERKGNVKVLDMSKTFSTLAIQARKLGASECVCLVNSVHHQQILRQLCIINQVDNVRIETDLGNISDVKFDCIVMDPISPNGTLKKDILKEVLMVRRNMLKRSGMIIPGKVRLMSTCIKCAQLLERCSVVDNENVCGLNIKHTINSYCEVFPKQLAGIDMSTLVWENLTMPEELLTLDFNQINEAEVIDTKSSVKVRNFRQGSAQKRIDAILYWFTLELSDKETVTTVDSNKHWKQAAVISDIRPECGRVNFQIETLISNGCLQIRECPSK